MGKFWSIILLAFTSLTAVEIPIDESVKSSLLKRGVEVWIKEHLSTPPSVACRFVGQDPIQGKPQIFEYNFSLEEFEEELSSFLDYCEEEIHKKGGASVGLVAVGTVDPEGLKHYLANRYDQSTIENEISEEDIQLIPTPGSQEFDVLLSYPTILEPVQSDDDLKKLWTFYLVQSMAENRLKRATVEMDGKWVAPEAAKYLLPAQATVGRAVEITQDTAATSPLLKKLLESIQVLKEKGFTENELADAKSQLLKHIKCFYEAHPRDETLADYYASHMAVSLPCPEYAPFMALTLRIIPEIGILDVAEMLNASFRDDSRRVIIRHPEVSTLSIANVESTLKQYDTNKMKFKYDASAKIELIENKDPFLQLPITEDEQKLIRSVIQTVAEKNVFKLGLIYGDLEEKRKKLIHIHPLRSIAAMCSDPYTKKCLAELKNTTFKWSSFIKDFSKRMKQELERDNLMMYVPGFCTALKANPKQVRAYIENKQWEQLVQYLVTIK
jgi:hypothetical protein